MWYREWIGPETFCSCLTPSALHFHLQQHPSLCSSQGSSAAGEWNPRAFFARCLHSPAAARVGGRSAALLHPGHSTHISSHLAQSPQLLFVTSQLPLTLLDRDFMPCAPTKRLRACKGTHRPGACQTLSSASTWTKAQHITTVLEGTLYTLCCVGGVCFRDYLRYVLMAPAHLSWAGEVRLPLKQNLGLSSHTSAMVHPALRHQLHVWLECPKRTRG